VKLRDVFDAAARRLDRGENHYCCTAICAAAGWGQDLPRVGIYTCPAVARFLELCCGPIKDDEHDLASHDLTERVIKEARAAVGANASEAQLRHACYLARVNLLRVAAKLVGDEEL